MKVSVIVPVYKVETYLPVCLQSILVQSYRNLEIILVDDGSPDNCGAICDEYALQDSRIRVIHKENGGLSDARNIGMAAVTGEYVLFLDGDDLWDDPYAIERLVERQKFTNADIINFSYVRWFEYKSKNEPYFSNIPSMPIHLSKEEQLAYLMEHGLYIASACNKMIRRRLLDGLEFQKGVYSEDIEWCAKLLIKARSVDYVCENFYLYRQHPTSIRHTINLKKCDDLANSIIACIRLIDLPEECYKELLAKYTAFQFGTFFAVQAQSQAVPVESIEKLQQYRWILLHHGNNVKLKLLYWCSLILGYKGLCGVVRLLFRFIA